MISQAAFNKEDANAGASTVETTTLSQRLIYLTFDQNSKQDKVCKLLPSHRFYSYEIISKQNDKSWARSL